MICMKLSIIIPVYKVERYLNQCIQSIIDQLHDDIEIILIDDGSPDRCPQMCDEWAGKFGCIRVIHQQNQGLSMARNNGIEVAKGDYVWFVDSDDWLLSNAIDDVFSAMRKYPNVEVFSSLMRKYYEFTAKFEDVQCEYCGHSLSGKSYMSHHCPKGASQRFIYKRSFINDNSLCFYPGVLHEDGIWGNCMLYLAKNVYILSRPIYVYRLRDEGSIMSSIKVKSAYDLITGHEVLLDFMYKKVSKCDYNFFRCQIFSMIESSFVFCRHLFQSSEYAAFWHEKKKYIRKESLAILSIRPYRITIWLMYINPFFVIWYIDLKSKIKELIKILIKRQ